MVIAHFAIPDRAEVAITVSGPADGTAAGDAVMSLASSQFRARNASFREDDRFVSREPVVHRQIHLRWLVRSACRFCAASISSANRAAEISPHRFRSRLLPLVLSSTILLFTKEKTRHAAVLDAHLDHRGFLISPALLHAQLAAVFHGVRNTHGAERPQDTSPRGRMERTVVHPSSAPTRSGEITTAGAFTEYAVPTASSQPWGIAAGHRMARSSVSPGHPRNKIGRITTAGVVTEYPIPTANSGPLGTSPRGRMGRCGLQRTQRQ